jgi:hypothetical protein
VASKNHFTYIDSDSTVLKIIVNLIKIDLAKDFINYSILNILYTSLFDNLSHVYLTKVGSLSAIYAIR